MVKILTQNVRGLQERLKRRSVYNHLRPKADIICLQETHSENSTETFWKNEYGGLAYWSSYNSQARGVAILINKSSEIEVSASFSDNQGRIVGIQFKLSDQIFTLINVYAPNEDSPSFWVEVFKYFEEFPGNRLLVGDFNLAFDRSLDRSNINSRNNDQSAAIVKQYMQDTFFNDVWRNRNPDSAKFTFVKKRPYVASRLDYILLEASVDSWCDNIQIIPGFRSDHSAVVANILPYSCERGRGYWKLNNQVLYETNFVKKINTVIEETEQRSHRLPPDEQFEMIKLNIIAEAQVYCQNRASERKLIISQLEEQIEKLTAQVQGPNVLQSTNVLLEKTIRDHEEIMLEKTKGAIFRSGAKFYAEGERSTKYFFQLEKYRSGAKGMNSILSNGQVLSDPKIILEMQKNYYKKLYTRDDSVHFDYENDTDIRLSEQQANSAEGLFTLEEIHSAVKSLNRNTCPGCDGLTTEFYCVFYDKLKFLLRDAFNHCYEKGVLYPSALRGVINLIPKPKKDIRQLDSMRPITILPTDYKIVEKILAQRIKPLLETLINEDQKGFMASRRISCNIRRMFDIIQYTEDEDLAGVIISMDFRKCFDRIEINAILGSLDYFSFKSSYKRWTELIYTNPIACVSNNGHFSDYFPVTRSVKQGGPNSAYYFLLLAEVLAIELRKNKNIQGFCVNEIMRILGQYADDMDLYLQGNAKSINSVFDVINVFQRRSGFSVNYDKTTLYRIGSIKNTQIKFVTKKELKWSNDGINVLGVEIPSQIERVFEANYTPLFNKIKATLDAWGNRGLSLFGKILIFNTLIASLFVYKMSVIPTIPDNFVRKLNEICENFIWNGRRPKIPIKILQANRDEGGAGLVNFELKDASLKASWLQILLTDPFLASFAYSKLSKELQEDIWNVNIKGNDVVKLFQNSFWRDVLQAWSSFNYKPQPQGKEILGQFLWFNSHIRIGGKPILMNKPYKEGLKYLSQIVNVTGNFLPVQIICDMFQLTMMECNSLISAIPKEWKVKCEEIPEVNVEYDVNYNMFLRKSKCASYYYKMVNVQNGVAKNAIKKWEKAGFLWEYGDFIELFNNVYKITTNTKLRSFQYRFLHYSIVLNSHLFRWKIKNDNLCTFCQESKEDIVHIFLKCSIVKNFWSGIRKICSGMGNFTLNDSESNILFCLVHPSPEHIYNFVYLVAKQYIYATKCLNKQPSIIEFERRLAKIRSFECYYAKINNKLSSHCKKWLLRNESSGDIAYNGTNLDIDIATQYINNTIENVE